MCIRDRIHCASILFAGIRSLVSYCHSQDYFHYICTVSLSPEKNIGDVVISDHTCTDHYIYSFEGRRWGKQPELILSDREKEILQLSVKMCIRDSISIDYLTKTPCFLEVGAIIGCKDTCFLHKNYKCVSK